MSEILNEALLGEIKRLRAIDIEGLGASIQRLENTSKENQRIGREVKENADQLGKRIAEVNIPAAIKVTRHLTIGAKDRYFAAFVISTLVFLLIGAAGVIYAVKTENKLAAAERAITSRDNFIDWMRKEKGGDSIYQKYIKKPN